jgi:hypothetical protein
VIERHWLVHAALVAAFGCLAAPAWAQQAEAASAHQASAVLVPSSGDAKTLPVSIDRIRDALKRTDVLVLDQQPVFRSGVTEHRPRSFDLPNLFAEPKAARVWQRGWHDEFVNMVTPPEFRQWQAFSGTNLAQVAATSLAQALMARGIRAAADAASAAREAAARRTVNAALASFYAASSAPSAGN